MKIENNQLWDKVFKLGFQLGIPLIKYLGLFYVCLLSNYGWYGLLSIIDGDVKRVLGLLSFGVRIWCI